jgi:hypothetical protein
MAALLIAWSVFALAVIFRAFLDTGPRMRLAECKITAAEQAMAEERAQMMETIATSTF